MEEIYLSVMVKIEDTVTLQIDLFLFFLITLMFKRQDEPDSVNPLC